MCDDVSRAGDIVLIVCTCVYVCGHVRVQEDDTTFLLQVLEEARAEQDSIITAARRELQAAADEAEFRALMPLLQQGTDTLSEDLLSQTLERAAGLHLSTHPSGSVREVVEAASRCLERIRKCKALLQSALQAVTVQSLTEAVAMASGTCALSCVVWLGVGALCSSVWLCSCIHACVRTHCDCVSGIGYQSPAAVRARELLTRIRNLEKQATYALQDVDRPTIETVLREAAGISYRLSCTEELAAVLALPPDLLLRRQLAAAVTQGNDKLVVELTINIKVRGCLSLSSVPARACV